jgi:hypothetical protein
MELIMWLTIGLIAALLIGCTPLLPIAAVAMLIVVLATMVRYHRDRAHSIAQREQALQGIGYRSMQACSVHVCMHSRRIRELQYRINKINNKIDYMAQLRIIDNSLPYGDTLYYGQIIATMERIKGRYINELLVLRKTRTKMNKVLAMQEGSVIEQAVRDSDEIVPLNENYFE